MILSISLFLLLVICGQEGMRKEMIRSFYRVFCLCSGLGSTSASFSLQINVKLPLENETSSHAWIQPSAPLFKVNADGAIFFFGHMCGVGVVIKHDKGLVVSALSKKLNLPLGPF